MPQSLAMGFGISQVKGRSLLPSPPAIITAFIKKHHASILFLLQLLCLVWHHDKPLRAANFPRLCKPITAAQNSKSLYVNQCKPLGFQQF
jgi:hypothetical protein